MIIESIQKWRETNNSFCSLPRKQTKAVLNVCNIYSPTFINSFLHTVPGSAIWRMVPLEPVLQVVSQIPTNHTGNINIGLTQDFLLNTSTNEGPKFFRIPTRLTANPGVYAHNFLAHFI